MSADKIWRKTKARLDTVSGFHVSAELPPTVKGTKYVRFNFSMGDEGRAFGRLSVVAGNREYSTTPTIGLTGRAKKDTDTVFVSTTGPLAPELLQVSLDDHHYYRFDTWNDPVKLGAQEPGAVSLDR